LLSHTEGQAEAEGVQEHSAEKIFGPKEEEVTGEWRKLHSEGLHDLYCSPNATWVIKSRRMKWAGDVVYMGREEGELEDLHIDGRIILKCIFKN
jgi:hypothetical protein